MRDTKDNYSVPEVEISYKPTKHSVRVTGS
ncbi:DNA repair protein RadC, partial [Elizabethkingia meningoseptica]|nr:DNA repair protein RadC [Elizabethkingia meningoseptica]